MAKITKEHIRKLVRESLDEISINAKKRNADNAINFFKNKKRGYNAIHSIGVLTGENPNSQFAGKKSKL